MPFFALYHETLSQCLAGYRIPYEFNVVDTIRFAVLEVFAAPLFWDGHSPSPPVAGFAYRLLRDRRGDFCAHRLRG
jgi:hypothetical protein